MTRATFSNQRVCQKLAADIERLGSKSPIHHIRRAIFGPIEVREKGRIKKRPLFDVYVKKTSEDAARGSTSAMSQTTWLTSLLIKKSILHEPLQEDPEIVAARQRLARDKRFSDHLATEAAHIVCELLKDFENAYDVHKVRSGPIRLPIPYEWKDEVEKLLPKVERAAKRLVMKRRRQAGGSEVGYCRPPQHTQWKPGQSGNPSGKRRDGADVWDSHRKALMKIISITIEGSIRKSTSIAVAVRQMFTEAMQGTPGAHQQVKKLLIQLDNLGALSPPPKSKRRPRPTSAEMAQFADMRLRVRRRLLPIVKARMVEEYERAFGSVSPFTTRLERELEGPTLVLRPRTRTRTRPPPSAPSESVPTPNPSAGVPRTRIRSRTRSGGSSDV